MQAVMATLAFVKGIKGTIATCENAVSSPMYWGTFNNIFNTVQDPVHHLKFVKENAILNGKVITKELH